MARFEVYISDEGLAEIDGESLVPAPGQSVHEVVLDKLHRYAVGYGGPVEATVTERPDTGHFVLEVAPDGSSRLLTSEEEPFPDPENEPFSDSEPESVPVPAPQPEPLPESADPTPWPASEPGSASEPGMGPGPEPVLRSGGVSEPRHAPEPEREREFVAGSQAVLEPVRVSQPEPEPESGLELALATEPAPEPAPGPGPGVTAISAAVARAAAAARAATPAPVPAPAPTQPTTPPLPAISLPTELAGQIGHVNDLARAGRLEEAYGLASELRERLTDEAGADDPHAVEARAVEAYIAHLCGDHREAIVLALAVARIRCGAGDRRAPEDVARAVAAWQWLDDERAIEVHGHELLHMWEQLDRRGFLQPSHAALAGRVRKRVDELEVFV